MDAITISLFVGIATLLIERLYKLGRHVKSSKCLGSEIEFDNNDKK